MSDGDVGGLLKSVTHGAANSAAKVSIYLMYLFSLHKISYLFLKEMMVFVCMTLSVGSFFRFLAVSRMELARPRYMTSITKKG